MQGEEVGRGTSKKEAQGMRLVPVLEPNVSEKIPVQNTSAARTFAAGTITVM
jgi:hypothetical protein